MIQTLWRRNSSKLAEHIAVMAQSHLAGENSIQHGPRVALLTPYSGKNLGDAAIQDAMIANLRLRLPKVEFSGITLSSENFVERHGSDAFPLCASSQAFYGMGNRESDHLQGEVPQSRIRYTTAAMYLRRRFPDVWKWLSIAKRSVTLPLKEFRHCVAGFRFLRQQDIVIVSGGGQLDEEWGGEWGHPLALLKWGLLARAVGVPYAIASVGACRVVSRRTRTFLRSALRLASYRSFRDAESRKIACEFADFVENDTVVPDLAFTLVLRQPPASGRFESLARGRRVIAISTIAFAKPGLWPSEDAATYYRYVEEMTRVVSLLLERNCYLVFVVSSLDDDETVLPEILSRLRLHSKERAQEQIQIPSIACWEELLQSLLHSEVLIASRLHSAILGFVSETPTIAISFDPKVDWVMKAVGQCDYLLQIGEFCADDVLDAVDRVEANRNSVVAQIRSFKSRNTVAFDEQYDRLAELAIRRCCGAGGSTRTGVA